MTLGKKNKSLILIRLVMYVELKLGFFRIAFIV